MPSIPIWHLIYTRVEPDYSPAHKNGFQTVYFSPEIKDDVAGIERLIQCFIPTDAHVQDRVPEYQYFWTESNNAVIVQTLPIEADPKVIDASGRRTGHFVSHALVISREQFARIGNDPFAVIAAADSVELFTDSVETVVGLTRQETPPDRLNVKRRVKLDDDLPEDWSVNLEKVAWLAQSAAELTAKKNSLLLLSDDSYMIRALFSTALYLMDAEHRVACTFNTFVDGCVPSAGTYWAVGARKRISGSGFTTLDLSSGSLEIKQLSNDPKASPYSLWLRQTLKSYGEHSIGMTEIYAAQIAAECLAAKRPLPADEPLSETGLTTFREVNSERYHTGLVKGLTEALGKSITEQFENVLVTLVGIRAVIDIGAQESVDPATLAPILYGWVVKNAASIKAWNDLLKFAQTARFDPLIALAGARAPSNILTGNKAAIASSAALERLAQNGKLQQYLDDLRSALDIDDLVTPVTASIISSEIDVESLDDEVFVKLAISLIKKYPPAIDERYSVRVRRVINKQTLKDLSKLVKKTDHLTSDFVQAVQEIT